MKKSTIIILAVIVVVLVAVGVIVAGGKKDTTSTAGNMNTMPSNQSSANSESTKASEAVATDAVTIANYAFSPSKITVKVGATVTWTNQDSVQHNVSSDDGKMTSGPLLAKGETYKYTFTKAGTYAYHCSPHPYMHGTVVVTE